MELGVQGVQLHTHFLALTCSKATFEQNILICYRETIWHLEIDNTSFESPISELLALLVKVGVAFPKRLLRLLNE